MPSTLPDGDLPDEPTVDAGVRVAPVTDAPTRRRRLLALLLGLAAGVLVVDQLTKAWALNALDGERRDVLGSLLGLQLVFNEGAALSIAEGMTWVLTLVAVVVVVVIVRVAQRIGSTAWAVALGLLLGGAVGNLVDRLVREPGFARGRVIDFIAYLDWFVGNVADIAIVVAAGLVVLLVARGIRVDGTRESDHHESDRHGPESPAESPAESPSDDHGSDAADEAERARG
ncbi:signal peptidase II [Cellulomonas palmilytica]|uniref:signal peptidase II n=1 Tax=Cellulomonas palmilytica TaxID=2608402 RepID=UPI0037C195A6|nr:signal peptidase II [Cellulomonas palmilytica]